MKGYVYHIKDPNNIGLDFGYIGVVKKDKGVLKRFMEHKSSNKMKLGQAIKKYNLTFEDVDMILETNIKDCYEYENKLRPKQNMGWNIATGGGGPYYSSIPDLSIHRSKLQIERMKDKELKKCQGESFKRNYYANEESQQLRRLRA